MDDARWARRAALAGYGASLIVIAAGALAGDQVLLLAGLVALAALLLVTRA